MSDTITVMFGGREVVLKQPTISGFWKKEEGAAWALQTGEIGGKCDAKAFIGRDYSCYVKAVYDSPQSAVTALESKLRALRDELNEVLGTSAPADRPEEVGGREGSGRAS